MRRNIQLTGIVEYVHIMPESFTVMQITMIDNLTYIVSDVLRGAFLHN